jgi:uncharacterized protein (DUF58 family)
VLFAGVAAVVALGIVWPWVNLCGLSGEIAFDRARAVEGDTVGVAMNLKNRLPWSAVGLIVRGGFGSGEERRSAAASVAGTPGRRSARCQWCFIPTSRGLYPLEQPHIASAFPFGLWENARRLQIAAPVVVWPRTYPVGPPLLVSGDQQAEGIVARHKVGTSGDVLGVRPYRRGDSTRRIHWGQSARHDRLIVCELQASARPVLQLVLDTDPQSHVGVGPDGSREWAIRIVASLAKGWLAAGAEVGAAWPGEVVAPASGQAHAQLLLDRLAQLPDTPGRTLADTLALPACRAFRAGLQIIVTTDAALQDLAHAACAGAEQQRWVILKTAAFGGADEIHLPLRPWLLLDSIERIPALLRGGWAEARHGS